MAHEIDMSNGRANTAYVGKVPWHGLGQRVSPDADLETWRKAGGLEWDALLQDIGYIHNGQARTWPDRRVMFRSDTGEPLSVVSDRYKPVQPGEVLEFFRDLVDAEGSFRIETVGSLRGGRKVWALAKAADTITLPGNDVVERYLLMATSYDFSLPTIVMPTSVRVVCANTLHLAAGVSGKNANARVFHTAKFDEKQIKEELGFTEAWKEFSSLTHQLATTTLPDRLAPEFVLKSFFRDEQIKNPELQGRRDKVLEEVLPLLQTSPGGGMESARGTLWGGVNAITYHVDHASRAHSNDNRMNRAWFGSGARIKDRAMRTAVEMLA